MRKKIDDSFRNAFKKIGRFNFTLIVSSVLVIALAATGIGFNGAYRSLLGSATTTEEKGLDLPDIEKADPSLLVSILETTAKKGVIYYTGIVTVNNAKFNGEKISPSDISFDGGFADAKISDIETIDTQNLIVKFSRTIDQRSEKGFDGSLLIAQDKVVKSAGVALDQPAVEGEIVDDYVVSSSNIDSVRSGQLKYSINETLWNSFSTFANSSLSFGAKYAERWSSFATTLTSGLDSLIQWNIDRGWRDFSPFFNSVLHSTKGLLDFTTSLMSALKTIAPIFEGIVLLWTLMKSLTSGNTEAKTDPVLLALEAISKQIDGIKDKMDESTQDVIDMVGMNTLKARLNTLFDTETEFAQYHKSTTNTQFNYLFDKVIDLSGISGQDKANLKINNLKFWSVLPNRIKNTGEDVTTQVTISEFLSLLESVYSNSVVDDEPNHSDYHNSFMTLLKQFNGNPSLDVDDIFTNVDEYFSYAYNWNNQTFGARQNYLQSLQKTVNDSYMIDSFALSNDLSKQKSIVDRSEEVINKMLDEGICNTSGKCFTEDGGELQKEAEATFKSYSNKKFKAEKNINSKTMPALMDLIKEYNIFCANAREFGASLFQEIATYTPKKDRTEAQAVAAHFKDDANADGGVVISYRLKAFMTRKPITLEPDYFVDKNATFNLGTTSDLSTGVMEGGSFAGPGFEDAKDKWTHGTMYRTDVKKVLFKPEKSSFVTHQVTPRCTSYLFDGDTELWWGHYESKLAGTEFGCKWIDKGWQWSWASTKGDYSEALLLRLGLIEESSLRCSDESKNCLWKGMKAGDSTKKLTWSNDGYRRISLHASLRNTNVQKELNSFIQGDYNVWTGYDHQPLFNKIKSESYARNLWIDTDYYERSYDVVTITNKDSSPQNVPVLWIGAFDAPSVDTIEHFVGLFIQAEDANGYGMTMASLGSSFQYLGFVEFGTDADGVKDKWLNGAELLKLLPASDVGVLEYVENVEAVLGNTTSDSQ